MKTLWTHYIIYGADAHDRVKHELPVFMKEGVSPSASTIGFSYDKETIEKAIVEREKRNRALKLHRYEVALPVKATSELTYLPEDSRDLCYPNFVDQSMHHCLGVALAYRSSDYQYLSKAANDDKTNTLAEKLKQGNVVCTRRTLNDTGSVVILLVIKCTKLFTNTFHLADGVITDESEEEIENSLENFVDRVENIFRLRGCDDPHQTDVSLVTKCSSH